MFAGTITITGLENKTKTSKENFEGVFMTTMMFIFLIMSIIFSILFDDRTFYLPFIATITYGIFLKLENQIRLKEMELELERIRQENNLDYSGACNRPIDESKIIIEK